MKTEAMKTIFVRASLLLTGALGLVMVSGCVVEVTPGGPPPPPVVMAPPPVVEVPDYYVWDGDEYVGMIGPNYYYLGPGQAWVVCDPVRVQRFNVWVGYHPDWRSHMTYNDHYRRDAHGAFHPVTQNGVRPDIRVNEHVTGQGEDRPEVQGSDHPMGQTGPAHHSPVKKAKAPPKNEEHH
jgi:hypothetical protein